MVLLEVLDLDRSIGNYDCSYNPNSPLEQNDPMLTLDQLISEATALSDEAKALLIDKIVESMTIQPDRNISIEGVKKAQERIAEIDSGAVQTITGDVALSTEPIEEDANFFFTANQEYPVWSPYNCSEAANTLMNLLVTKQSNSYK